MSTHEADEEPLQHSAPPYSIIERRIIGMTVVTTVVLDGEVCDFERPMKLQGNPGPESGVSETT